MVHREVWRAATGGERRIRFLHLECLEKRLGRLLTLSDFVEAPINNAIRWAWKRSSR